MDDDLQADLAQVPSLKDLIERDLARVPKAPQTPPVRQTISDYAKQFARGAASQLVTAPGQLMVRAGLRPVTRDLGLRLQQQATDAMSQDAKTIGASTFLGDDGNVFGPYPVQKALSAITESAPGLVGLAATGGVAARALQQAKVGERVAGAATAAGVPQAVGRMAGEIAETSPYWIGEGLQAGGANAAEIGQQFRDAERMPVEKMAGSEAFQAAMRESLTASPGWTAQQHVDAVREVMARRAESEAFDKTMASTAGIGAVTSGGALGVIARRLGGQDTGGFLRTTLRGTGRESLQEIPQSGGEQLIANYVTRKYGNPEQPLLEGGGEAMALGGVAGAATGGGLAAGTYPFTRRAQAVEGAPPGSAPPGSAPTPPQPMAPPPDPAGPLGGAVAAGQQSGAIPINPIGGPVDAPPAPPAPPAASAPTEADSAPEGVFGGERAGQPKQAPGTETRTAWKTLPEVEAFLSAARQQSPQLPAGKPVQRADGLFTFALPGEPEFDMLADARNAPAARAERERRADKALQSVESLTRRLAQASAASQKARDTGDAETAANAESLADVLRDRLAAARNQLEAVSGYPAPRSNVDAGASAGVVGNGGVGAAGRVDLPRGSAAPDGATLAGSAAGGTAPEGLVAAPADGGGARPVVLQNRDRSGVASVTQMQSIAASPDPKRLSFSRDFGSGAPVVFANADALQVQPVQLGREDTITDAQGRQYAVQYAVIEADQVVASNSADGAPNDLYQDSATPGLIRAVAGNGRMAGLQEAYRRGTAADYARGIAGDAALHGVDPAVIEGLSNPVLVRVMRSADVTPDIGDRSNVSGISQLNPVEQARTDMARVNLDGLEFGEDGAPTVESVRRFVRAMPAPEQSSLMMAGGAPGKQAVDRLMAATFAKAYGATDLIELYAQATDPEARNVISALAQAAGPMARLEGAGDLDIRPAVMEAVRAAVNASRRGVSLAKFSQQRDFDVTPEAWRVVEHFVANARSAKRMAEGLRNLADAAYAESQKGDVDMFGAVPKRTGGQVINEVFDGQQREGDAGADANAGRAGLDEEGAGGRGGRQDERAPASDPGQPATEGRPADGQAGSFGLVAPTREDILRQQEIAEREAQGDTAPAAPAPDDFTLTGSNSPVDQARARGQMELGGEAPVDAAAAQAATSPKNDTPEPTGQRDSRGLTAADRYAQKIDSAASELAGQIVEETKDGDYDGLLATIKRWAKDAKVAADDLRAAVLKALDKIDAPVKQKNAIRLALNPARMVAQAEKAETFVPAPDGSQAAQAGPTSEVVADVRIEEDAQADRIKLIFDGKPDEATRAALKAAGFRWAPSAGAWQRQLTDNARAAARRILDARRAGDDAADTQADAPAFSRRGWRADFPDAVLGHRQGVVHAHPDYQAAKAGDDRAALRLARDMATDDYVAAIRGALPVDARPTIVPVLAVEAAGNNRIPLAIAKVLGDKLGLPVATNIVQARKVSRGGSDGFHRLANPPNFTGPVVAGDYLILDDTLTQGGTLAQLKTHIEDNGGRVLLASALTGKTYSARIALSNERLTQLRERYGSIEPWWRNTFGYGFDGLTESEARFILSLRDRPGSDTLRDRVVAARVRGVGGVDGRDDSDGRDQPPVASRRATEPATTPYETDLFGNPLPAPPRRAQAARPDRAGLPGDVQPAATVQDTEAPAGDYFVRTVVGVTAHRRLGANRILTPGDAARATRYLYRSAVERFDGIVTDAAGKPLAVIGGFKGALTQTAVYPATLVGEAVRIPGAARIWFSHNHPSGKAELSAADRMLHQTVADVFRGSGIEPMGLLAVAGDRFAYQSAEPGGDATAHEPIPASDSAAEGARKGRKIAAPSLDGVTVPVIEREIAPDSDVSGHVISAPNDAIDIGRVFYDRAKAPGLMLVNAQHRVIGWVPLPTNTMGDLRNTGGLRALYRAVSESNAAGAVLVHGGEPALSQTVGGGRHVTVAQNIGAALRNIDAALLDSIDVVRGESAASRGAEISAGPVYARGQPAQPGSLPADRVTAIAAAVSRAWTNAPDVVVVADMGDPRIPQAVRDYDAEQRSQGAGEPEGFFLDGKVYLVAGQLATPADVVRVLAHEALGHYGLRGLFGGELGRILDQIAAVRRAEVEAKRQEYGLPDTAAGRRVAAEEVLAGMAQTNPQLGFVRRAVAAIRAWLRGLGLNLRMTDDEIIRSFILPARAWVQSGAGRPSGAAAFSRRAVEQGYITQSRWEELRDGVRQEGVAGKSRQGADDRGAAGTDTGDPAAVGGSLKRFFHGTSDDIRPGFDLEHPGRKDAGWLGEGVYVTDDPDLAEAYAALKTGEAGPNVLPLALRIKSPYVASLSDKRRISTLSKAEIKRLTDRLMALGHDSVVLTYPNGTSEVVVFDPANVRSYHAEFKDGDSTDLLFSRKPTAESVQAAVGQAAQALRGATLAGIWQRVVNAATDMKPLFLQLLGRRQIVDIYGDLLPQLEAYSNRMQQYDADKNESAAAADDIVSQWRRLPDADRLADVMHGATLAGYDPDVDETPANLLTPEMRAVHDGFVGLSPKAKALYRTARDAYLAHWNAVKRAIGERIERADIAENDRRALMEKYRDEFLKPIEGVYFPLARFGDYVITAKDADGNNVVAFAETMTEAQAEQARMRREYQDVSKITKRREYNAARDSVSREFVRKLFSAIDETTADGQEADMLKDSVNQLYLTSLPDVSWAKHGIHRKGVAGYSKDARRAFAANMFHGGYHLAKLRHADVLQDYLREMQEHVEAQRTNEAYDSVVGQQVIDEMVKRHDATMNPDNNRLANTLTGIGFVWFLGLSPAAAIVNLSQTALVAYPIIAARYGFGATADALTRASSETLAAKNDMRGRLKGDEAEAYERAIREGWIGTTQSHDLAGIAEGRDSGLQSKFSPIMRAASWMFHQAEMFNRQATFLAVYRLARGKGSDAEAAYDIARDLTYKGHYDYAQSNRPRVMMGPVARVALLFKQYGQNMIYTLARNALLAARGDRVALKTVSGVLVGHALTAGILGLPLASVLLGAASLLGGSDDEPWDAEVALRNYLADAFGPAMGELISRGAFRAVFPGDIASRVGLDSILIRDIDLTLEPNKVWQEILNAILGPVAGGIPMNVSAGVSDLARGDLLRGVQAMLPKAIGDGFKVLRYWNDDGVVDRTGVEVLDNVTASDLAAQAIGFAPARVSEAYAGRRAIMGQKRGLDQRRETLLRDFSTAVIGKNDEKRLRALQEIQHFNTINPTVPITSQSLLRSIQNRMRRQAEASSGVYLPRRQRHLEQEGRFANVN